MSLLLIKYRADYADEFDVHGFAVYQDTAWKAHLAAAKQFILENGSNQEVGFGTNEGITYEDIDSYTEAFSTQPISEDEAKSITALFNLKVNGPGYGHFLILEDA